MSVTQFPCKSCGAKLEFSPGTDALKCPYCGHENMIPKSEEDIEELDFRKYLSQAVSEEEMEEEQRVKCNACGAESSLDPNITMSHCPFCGTQLMAEAKTSRLLKPKSLLPFKVDKRTAMDQFRSWVAGLWFAPGDLKRYARTESGLRGMYIPYWTYDTDTWSYYTGERGDDYTVTESYTEQDEDGNTVTKTREVVKTRWTHVSGTVFNDFDDVLVLASESLPRSKTEALEPWDLENLAPYAKEYLSGFQSEAYQVDLEQGFERAREIMAVEINGTIRRDIGGDHQRIQNVKTQYDHVTFKHLLLPIWINAYRYQNKSFRFVVNGRTGEVQGERPWSYVKIALAVAGVLAAGGLIYYLVKLYGG